MTSAVKYRRDYWWEIFFKNFSKQIFAKRRNKLKNKIQLNEKHVVSAKYLYAQVYLMLLKLAFIENNFPTDPFSTPYDSNSARLFFRHAVFHGWMDCQENAFRFHLHEIFFFNSFLTAVEWGCMFTEGCQI